jgi:hypothetical protein
MFDSASMGDGKEELRATSAGKDTRKSPQSPTLYPIILMSTRQKSATVLRSTTLMTPILKQAKAECSPGRAYEKAIRRGTHRYRSEIL